MDDRSGRGFFNDFESRFISDGMMNFFPASLLRPESGVVITGFQYGE